MKVLYISHYAGLGGAQKSLLAMIDYLRPMGVEPFVLIPCHGPVEEQFRRLNIPYEVVRFTSMRKPSQGKCRDRVEGFLRKKINYLTAYKISRKYKGQFDLIHANSSLAFFGCYLKRRLQIPLVWHLREFGDLDYPLSFIGGNEYSKCCYENADALIAISKTIQSHYSKAIAPNGRYRLIYNGVDETVIPSKKMTDKSERPLRLCIVGGVTNGKNHRDLIEAAALMPKGSVEVDIIGSGDDTLQEELTRLAEKLGVSDIIRFCGQDNDICAKLSKYDVGLVTSINEAFGRIIIEYMLAGLVVVASNAGACPELIDDGLNGLLYELGNPSSLANCLTRLVNDHELLERLGKAGHAKAMSQFTAKNNATEVYNLYKELTSDK